MDETNHKKDLKKIVGPQPQGKSNIIDVGTHVNNFVKQNPNESIHSQVGEKERISRDAVKEPSELERGLLMARNLSCPECGSRKVWKAGFRDLKDDSKVQRWLCRACGYRFSQPNVEVNVGGKLAKTFDSRTDLLQRSVVKEDVSFEEASDDLPFSFGENIRSHKLTIVGKQSNTFPSYNSKRRVRASGKGAKNLEVRVRLHNA